MIGPVVDIKLEEPFDKIPPGVVISVKHFLTVPQSSIMKQSIRKHDHQIMKLTQANQRHEIEVIEVQSEISTQYITTSNFSGRHFCKVTATATSDCNHSSLARIFISKYMKRCPHENDCLYLFCACEGSESRLKDELRDQGHERTVAVMRTEIEKSPGVRYKISITGETDGDERLVGHEDLCKYDGVIMLGGFVKKPFSCGCDRETSEKGHCRNSKLIEITMDRVFDFPERIY